MANVLVEGRWLRWRFSKRAAPVRPKAVDSAVRMAFDMMLLPEIAFSSTFRSELFLILRGMWGDSR